jgi:hypothetical protein
MALGILWLAVGGAVLYLFLTHLWGSLPPDPAFRRRLFGWLLVLAMVSALYSFWRLRAQQAAGTDAPNPTPRFGLPRR